MGYQALYRRYRPARFEDFVGQEAVIKTLRSQIMSGRIFKEIVKGFKE